MSTTTAASRPATEAPETAAEAVRHHYAMGMRSGFEGREADLGRCILQALKDMDGAPLLDGREAELGRSVAVVLKTLQNTTPYVHEVNDALLKAHLIAIQFARNQGTLAELVEHDIRTMEPINKRMKTIIEKSGNKEIALIGMFDHTGCHYQFALDGRSEPGRRTWTSPFRTVLAAGRKIGQFDLTEKEIHDNWTRPRLMGYAKAMGVKIRISDWNDDGKVTVELAD